MANGLNKVLLLGNLGADPELKYTQQGKAVLNLRLATTESYMDASNARQERTEWHTVAIWGNRAEALSKLLRKGARVFVEGKISTTSYEKDGEKRYRTQITALDIILNGSASGQDPAGMSARGPASPMPRPSASVPTNNTRAVGDYGFDDYGSADSDIPF